VLEKLCQSKVHLEVPDDDDEQSKVTYTIIKIYLLNTFKNIYKRKIVKYL